MGIEKSQENKSLPAINPPAIHFIYEWHDKKDIRLNIHPETGNVVIAYEDADNSVKWIQKIESVFLFNYTQDKNSLHLLTVEGQKTSIIIIETGRLISSPNADKLKTWQGANLAEAQGLTEKVVHALRALGAVNLPETQNDIMDYYALNGRLAREHKVETEIDLP